MAAGRSNSTVLVIGGGIAGTTVASNLGRAGVTVHLVEKADEIGGHAKGMGCKATDACRRCNVCVANETLRLFGAVPNVHTHTGTHLAALETGANGCRYRAVLECNGGEASSVDVDSVVIAIGYEPYDPVENSSFSYGSLPNVITGMEAEHQLFAANRLTRVSDGQAPQRVAFIQCVGSRTEEIHRRPEDTDYCSAVCCAYALRMARQLKYQAEECDVTVFYMDIQNFGKGFDQFYSECRNSIRFVRSRPYELRAGDGGAVCVKYVAEADADGADGCVAEEAFDLVILSVGIRPPADACDLAEKLGVALDEQGFFGLKGASPFPDLQREGIYVAGASESPRDTAGCIAQADAVSARVLSEV